MHSLTNLSNIHFINVVKAIELAGFADTLPSTALLKGMTYEGLSVEDQKEFITSLTRHIIAGNISLSEIAREGEDISGSA